MYSDGCPILWPIWFWDLFECMNEGTNEWMRCCSSKPISGSDSSGNEFCLLLSWSLPSVISIRSPVFAQKHVLLVSTHMLALVCPLVSHRVMKSVLLFLHLPPFPQLLDCWPPTCPASPSLWLSSTYVSHQPSSGRVSVVQSAQNLDWNLCLYLVHVLGVCGFQDKCDPLRWAELPEGQRAAFTLTLNSKPGFRAYFSCLNGPSSVCHISA